MPIKNQRIKEFFVWLLCIIITIAISLIIRCFVCVPTTVKQTSMYPTLEPNQKLLLSRVEKTFSSEYKRGDIVTFEAPSETSLPANQTNINYPVAKYERQITGLIASFKYYVLEIGKISYIKRIIGLPGEHIKIENDNVYINGILLEEPYLKNSQKTTKQDGAFFDITVPEGTVFVMGDNREGSTDSRKFGCIPINKIEGKVWLRIWPLNATVIVE